MSMIKRVGRLTAVLLLAAMAASLFLPAAAAAAGNFTDVSSSSWYYEAVNFVVGRGLFQGTTSTTFSPNVKMSRAMFVTVLGRYANVDAPAWLSGTVTGSGVNLRSGAGTDYSVTATMEKGDVVTILDKSGDWYKVDTGSATGYVSGQYLSPVGSSFSDVSYSAYYAGYAVWANEKGIVTGTGGGNFSPSSNITREQMCVMMNRFAKVMGLSLSQSGSVVAFPDSDKISSWAKSDVEAMQRCGVIKGTNTGEFNPLGSATRAEAAAVIQRFDAACGGFSPPVQRPDIVPQPTEPDDETPAPDATPTQPPADDGTLPPETDTPDADSVPDTPAVQIGGSVGIQASVIRVGVLVKTKNIDTSVSSVTLQNLNGSGFEYGVMSGRYFSSGGSISDTFITVTTDGSQFTVTDSSGSVVYTAASGELAIHPVSGGKAVTCVNSEYRYYGDFNLLQASGKPGYITVVNYLGVEDYVKGVLPFEFSNSWPSEVMKAAAIVCRSYVMSYDWGIYSPYGMDIVTGSGTQIYRGRAITYAESYFSASDAAVDATSGLYLTYNGSICITSYSSCDGGETLSSSAVFGTNYPYLVGKKDPFEQAAKGDIAAAGGNYASMVSASHRVGMSAWGAYAMAKYYNKSCESILGFYYTGTNLQYGG